jgi:hypothetical protein
MDSADKYENFREITSEAGSAWIKRKRKINTEILITEIARGKVNRLGLRQIAYQSNSIISASALVHALVRSSTSVKLVQVDATHVDRPDTTLQSVRAFRACALALFATLSHHIVGVFTQSRCQRHDVLRNNNHSDFLVASVHKHVVNCLAF